MNKQSIENLQVTLACQVTQKNALISAVKLASLCYWAGNMKTSAEVCIAQHGTEISTVKISTGINDFILVFKHIL